jgi:hypothetical protein
VRRPWPALLLLLGGALLLVSLYLPWQRVSFDLHEFGVGPFAPEPFDGWASGVAPAAALAALLLVGLSAVALARPELATRLPLGRCAIATAYFGVALAVDTRSHGEPAVRETEADLRLASGAYLGLGAATAVLLAALALRRGKLRQLRSPFAVTAAILTTGLLLVFLLPWAQLMEFEYTGIGAATAQVAVVVAICTPSGPRRLALLVSLFAAASFSLATTSGLERTYGAWLELGLAIAFALLSLSAGIRRPELERIPWTRLVLSAAALLLVTSFFLPWQAVCYPAEALGTPSGLCVSAKGWASEAAAAAALLATALIVGAVRRLDWLPPRAELAVGIALLVTTLGFQFGHGGIFGLGYGFWIGAACTAVIVVLVATRVRPPPLDARLAPIALCLAYLAVVVPTWWGVLDPFGPRRFLWFAPFSWITVAGALLALTLIRLWLERPPNTLQLLVVPAVIAALAGLDLARWETITWGGGIVLALCGLLALCAFVEQRGGLGELRIPEILRVDRL